VARSHSRMGTNLERDEPAGQGAAAFIRIDGGEAVTSEVAKPATCPLPRPLT